MAADIAPELLKKIKKEFADNIENDKKASNLLDKIYSGKANYEDTGNFAERVGEALTKALSDNLSSDVLPDGKMYWNIVDRVLRPLLESDYEIVSEAAILTQEAMNKKAGIGIKAQKAKLNTDRIEGILNKIASADNFDDVEWILDSPIKTFSRSVADETLKANIVFLGMSGLQPRIIRKAESKCCKWCKNLAGVYKYPDVPKEVYQRHENCRCVVEYDPGDGRRQNVHSKKWTGAGENGNIEKRKSIKTSKEKKKPEDLEEELKGKTGLAYRISEHPKMFAAYTPKGLKDALENAGYETKPLGKGNFKGVPFEEGGGWRVNYGGDRYIQYHPENRSHHEGAYYKTANGIDGIVRYTLNGDVKND